MAMRHSRSMDDIIEDPEPPQNCENSHIHWIPTPKPKTPPAERKERKTAAEISKKLQENFVDFAMYMWSDPDENNIDLAKACFAEAIGTLILVFLGCGSCVTGWENSGPPTMVHISLVFGTAVATAVTVTGHVSGGHLNPAVSIGMLFLDRIKIRTCLLYITSQCLGSAIGAGILQLMTPEVLRDSIGATTLVEHITVGQGLVFEFVLTFILVFTVCAVTYPDADKSTSPAVAVGFAVSALCLVGIKFTGCSMNPARSFGPSLLTNNWKNHWVYWISPIAGAIVASNIFKFLKGQCCCKPYKKDLFYGTRPSSL